MTLCVLSALNTFLLRQGLDVCGRMRELHQTAQPLVLRIWRSARDVRSRDTLVQYLRIQLRLQVRIGRMLCMKCADLLAGHKCLAVAQEEGLTTESVSDHGHPLPSRV